MKKTAILLITCAFASFGAFAQINPHAIGLRLGGNGDVNGAEISYQQKISDKNRIEADLGFGAGKSENRLYVAGIYHWLWNITDKLNWYVGPGATVGLYQYDNSSDGINVGVGGQIGIEYDFQEKGAPILLSLDGRPMWDLLGDNAGLGWGAALGVRYIWGE